MTKDITQMSYAELLEHKKQTEELLTKQKDEAISKVADEVKAFIQKSGFTLEEVAPKLGIKSASKSTSSSTTKDKAPAVYFHPENPELGWSGKGRAPDWLKDMLGVEKVSKNDPEIAEKLEKLKK